MTFKTTFTTKTLSGFLFVVLFAWDSGAADSPDATKIRYKKGKDLSFEQLIIEGNNRRPELSIVTGDAESGINGLLRLRENFLDRMGGDNGETTEVAP